MTTVATGRVAETKAAEYLETHGFAIVARNWRNRWCELDIIARNAGVIHIIEVKYRATSRYGHAAEYINHDKASRLMRAATAWTWANHYTGPYQIDVISVEGALTAPSISFIENAIVAG